jgi:GNAT superfamily N-acetyltransferase
MMVRPATHADIPKVVEIVRGFHSESRYRAMRFSPKRVAEIAKFCIDKGFGVVVGDIDGMMFGVIDHHTLSMDLVATEIILYVKPEARGGFTAMRLIKAFTAWAHEKGAVECFAGSTAQIATGLTQRLYERNGFEVVGPLLARRL